MAQTLTAVTRLSTVQEIQEDDGGATLRFEEGGHGRLGRLGREDPKYAAHLRLARRSQERKHPIGLGFSNGEVLTDVCRADNDIPTTMEEHEPDRVRVLFQGHDGVFQLRRDHPEFARVRALLCEAIRQKAPVWFVAHKPDLALVDALPAGSARDGSTFQGDGARR